MFGMRQSDESRFDDAQARAAALRTPKAACTGCGCEAVDDGEMAFLCPSCRDNLAADDLAVIDARQAARKLWKLLQEPARHIHRSRLAAIFHLHLAGYLIDTDREQYEEAVTSKVAEVLATNRGNERTEERAA